jgi:hypothetical protein
MRRLIVLSTLLVTTSLAAAESLDEVPAAPATHGHVSVGVEVGNMRTLATGYHVDGSLQLRDLPLFAHAQLAAGNTGTEGSYQAARGGLEARLCVPRGLLCGFGGLDVGYRHDHVVNYPHYVGAPSRPAGQMTPFDAHDLLAVPRAGLELGAPIRLRAAVEMPMFARVDEAGTGRGLMFSVDMGWAF